MVKHDVYQQLDLRAPFVVDGRRVFDAAEVCPAHKLRGRERVGYEQAQRAAVPQVGYQPRQGAFWF